MGHLPSRNLIYLWRESESEKTVVEGDVVTHYYLLLFCSYNVF